MAQIPEIKGPDGTYRKSLLYSTTRGLASFEGTIDPDTVFMEVSLRGGAFIQDPGMVTFEGSSFRVPNPVVFPEGYRLLGGDNLLSVRSVLTNGTTTETATINVRYVKGAESESPTPAPTDLYIERLDGVVRIVIRKDTALDTYGSNLVGFNFYASPKSGGGDEGYFLINSGLIQKTDAKKRELTSTVSSLTAEASLSGHVNYRVRGDLVSPSDESIIISPEFDEIAAIPLGSQKVRMTTTLQTVRTIEEYSFYHNRDGNEESKYPTLPNSELSLVDNTIPLYYVASAIYYDPQLGLQVESPFSIEMSGIPLSVTPATAVFPAVSKTQISESLISSIYRSHPTVAVQPGSVLRDTFIDPFSSEAERLRFILDFMHRAQSFSTLLQIDDPNLTGISIAPNRSGYKLPLAQAFRMSELRRVQDMINMAFEKLASNFGMVRLKGRKAAGAVTFYLTNRPLSSTVVPIGTVVQSGSAQFITTTYIIFNVGNMAAYYDPTSGRYTQTVYVQAVSPGNSGNVTAGAISTTNVPNINVTNNSPTFGGQYEETNYELATRVMNALASVDSGTKQGLTQVVNLTPGVLESNLVLPGDALMERDVTPEGIHKGGKVDIWIRGSQLSSISDTFAFDYHNLFNITFEIVGNPSDLTFRAVYKDNAGNTLIDSENPLTEMLDFPNGDPPRGFYNRSKGYPFVLTDIAYLSYDQVQLSATYNDPSQLDLEDELRGDFRLLKGSSHRLGTQPVRSVRSVVGSNTGTVSAGSYSLMRTQSPLQEGYSSVADDYIQFSLPRSDTLGQVLTVSNETHTMIGNYVDYFNFLGVNPLTIKVYASVLKTLEYKPVSPNEGAPDYRVIAPADPTGQPFGIQRTENSRIPTGSSVFVDYSYNENVAVTYTPNILVTTAQEHINSKRHITADIIVKESLPIAVDITATIVLATGVVSSAVDRDVRTAIMTQVFGLGMGVSLRQSDIIETIDSINGVSYVVLPLTKMAIADDAMILRESVDTSDIGDILEISSWGTSVTKVYLVKDSLSHSTSNGGGGDTQYRAVSQDSVDMTLITSVPNNEGLPLNQSANNSFIIGSGGLDIPGYSDRDTLLPQVNGYPEFFSLQTKIDAGTASPSDIERYNVLTGELETGVIEMRKSLTANRIILVLDSTDSPSNHSYAVTYFTEGDTGVKDISIGPTDYVSLGDINLTFDSDQNLSRSFGRFKSSGGSY